MTWFVLQSLFLILGAFVLGLLVGWLAWGRRPAERPSPATAGGESLAPPVRATARREEDVTVVDRAVSDEDEEPAEFGGGQEQEQPGTPSSGVRSTDAAPVDATAGAGSQDSVQASSAGTSAPAAASAEPPVTPDDPASDSAPDSAPVRTRASEARRRADASLSQAPGGTAASRQSSGQPSSAHAVSSQQPSAQQGASPQQQPAAEQSAVEANGTPAAPTTSPAGGPAGDLQHRDDFRRIGGVGPKAALALYAAGIEHYEDLARCDEETLRGIMRQAGLRHSASLATWPHQAALLASDDFTAPPRPMSDPAR